jgi:hypothetical protein
LVLKVFVASPSGLDAERDAISEVAERLNTTIGAQLDIVLRIQRWEHVIGGAGRAQGQINPLLDDCDLFIGLLYRTWGSASGAGFSSGFEEEYELALSRRVDGAGPQIHLLFKEVDGDSVADPGAELARVLAFKERVRTKFEGLYSSFSSLDGLRYLTSLMLTAQMHEFGQVGDTGEGYSPRRSAANMESDSQAPSVLQNQILGVIEDVPRLLRGEIKRRDMDSDRLQLFSLSISRDEQSLSVHFLNRLFQRRDTLNITIAEANLWLSALLRDIGTSNEPSQRVVPFALLAFDEETLKLTLENASDEFVSSDDVNTRRGYLRLAGALGLRAKLLWPARSAKPSIKLEAVGKWSELAQGSTDLDVVKYVAAVGLTDDRKFLSAVSVGLSTSHPLLSRAIDGLLRGSVDEAIEGFPSLTQFSPIGSWAPSPNSPPWKLISKGLLETLVTGDRLSKRDQLFSARYLASEGHFSDSWAADAIDVKNENQISAWRHVARDELLDRPHNSETLSRIVAIIESADNSGHRDRLLARLGARNPGVKTGRPLVDLRQQPADESLGLINIEMSLRHASGTDKYVREARQIVAGTYKPLNKHIEDLGKLATSSDKADVSGFVRASSISAATKYLGSRPVDQWTASDRAQIQKLALTDGLQRRSMAMILMRNPRTEYADFLIRESRLEWDQDRQSALGQIMAAIPIAQVQRLLDSSDVDVAIAALAQLEASRRLPSIRSLVDLLYDERARLRVQVASLLTRSQSRAKVEELLASYSVERERHFYNVVAFLDWFLAEDPSLEAFF